MPISYVADHRKTVAECWGKISIFRVGLHDEFRLKLSIGVIVSSIVLGSVISSLAF